MHYTNDPQFNSRDFSKRMYDFTFGISNIPFGQSNTEKTGAYKKVTSPFALLGMAKKYSVGLITDRVLTERTFKDKSIQVKESFTTPSSKDKTFKDDSTETVDNCMYKANETFGLRECKELKYGIDTKARCGFGSSKSYRSQIVKPLEKLMPTNYYNKIVDRYSHIDMKPRAIKKINTTINKTNNNMRSPSLMLKKEDLAVIKELPESKSTSHIPVFNNDTLNAKHLKAEGEVMKRVNTLEDYVKAFDKSNVLKTPSVETLTRNSELAKHSLSTEPYTDRIKSLRNNDFDKREVEEVSKSKDYNPIASVNSAKSNFDITNSNNHFIHLMDQKYKECLQKFQYNKEWFEYQVDNNKDVSLTNSSSTLKGKSCSHGKVYICYQCNKPPTS